MSYSACFLYLIAAVSFFFFILSAVFILRGRGVIIRTLKEEQFEQYDELFGKRLDDSSLKDGLNIIGFFIFRKWDGLSVSARKLLERQRRIGILATLSYVVAKVCFLSALDGQTRTYEYNDDNRMVRAGNAEYAYNALGQRVRKSVNGTTTHFIYSPDGQLLAEGNHIQHTHLVYKLLGTSKTTNCTSCTTTT